MPKSAWAEDTGELPVVVVQTVTAGEPGNRVYLAVRDSLYLAIGDLFADPRCTEETRTLVREYLSGRKDAT